MHKHPSEWTIEKLVQYCDEHNIKVPNICSRDHLVELVLKDELDKE